jgi:hypothetical protein
VPHGNSFQVHFAAGKAEVEAGLTRLAEAEGVWVANRVVETGCPGECMIELVVGAATMEWGAEEVARVLGGLVDRRA